jgi:cytosine/adenosine deaminase-related metal-dependent hydrolase
MYRPLDFCDVLYLATRGGAQLLNMEDCLGSLETGKLADILLVDMEGRNKFIIITVFGMCALAGMSLKTLTFIVSC